MENADVGGRRAGPNWLSVVVTNGRFSAGVRQFAEALSMRLVLLDGAQLARSMVRYNVGLSTRELFELRQVDEDFFDE